MVQLGDFLKAIGPNAAIVFAAWIFMGFLQQRYDSAVDRFRDAVGDFRSRQHEDGRTQNLKDQILLYRRRCRMMGWATFVGLVSAILLISSLIFAGLDVIMPHTSPIIALGVATSFGGFGLVIVAALIVIVEGLTVNRQLDDETRDIPDLQKTSR